MTAPYVRRAQAGSLPAASRDAYRETVADHARAWSVADLKSWNARESTAAGRDDDPADAAGRALRSLGVIR